MDAVETALLQWRLKMKPQKTFWIICMAGLCLVLFTLVRSRSESTTQIIFGGAQGAYVDGNSASYINPDAVETPEPTVDIWPVLTDEDFDSNRQYSIVNDDNLLTSQFEPELATIPGTYYMKFSVDAIDHLKDMLQGLEDAGFNWYIYSAYRSYHQQTIYFNGKASQIAAGMGVTDYMDEKYQEAVEEAKTITAYPGASEHQLGLAVDLMDKRYYYLDYSQMNQKFYEWLDEHCAEYGFIKRYPTRKMLLTGWDEPWHYRYVGVEVAKFVMEQGICYEEFYAHYHPDFKY